MAKERTSVRMQAQIKLMSEQGYSIRAIARTLKISRKTVRRILGIAVAESSEPASWIGAVDWDSVRQEVYGKGTTVKQIQREQGRICGCQTFSYLIPTMDSIIEAIANRLKIRGDAFNVCNSQFQWFDWLTMRGI